MQLNINQQRNLWWGISLGAIALSLVAMVFSFQQFGVPIRPGLDFIGGTRLQLALECVEDQSCETPISPAEVRDILASQELENSSIQVVEDYTLSIRTKTLEPEERTALQTALTEEIGAFDPKTLQIDTVGPTIGAELLDAGVKALAASFFGIIAYLSFRFQFDYAIFAIIALFHDVLITAGVFALLGLTLGNEIDSLFLVALLTIIGFSVNDTVVIYDRIRENRENSDASFSILDVVDASVNQTLTRSINTTVTTTLPLFAIFLFGGDTLKFFALALIIGFILGSYSSIFIASTLLGWWQARQGKPEEILPTDDPTPDEV
ncbi:MAG: protein translocase subunit SecF [Spirulina sp. SIO3F2]|nr:protein translocase subunit SecF [Spirulina sp. SIO3F2]